MRKHMADVIKNLLLVLELLGPVSCSCDPEVGWVCETCFIRETARDAKEWLDFFVALDPTVSTREEAPDEPQTNRD